MPAEPKIVHFILFCILHKKPCTFILMFSLLPLPKGTWVSSRAVWKDAESDSLLDSWSDVWKVGLLIKFLGWAKNVVNFKLIFFSDCW